MSHTTSRIPRSAERPPVEADARGLAPQLARDEFLAALSRELRTPLNAILGWTQTLQAGSVRQDTLMRALAQIEQSAKYQARLIDDLLNASEIVAGRMRLDIRPMRLEQAIAEAAAALHPAIHAREIRLETKLDPAAGAIAADPARIRQVVWNLLSNAVKFTQRCGRVCVSLARAERNAVIRVSDDGEGIAPELLPRVFDRGQQTDSPDRQRHGGLGLGLLLTRHLVEMHGGTVAAHSAGPGRGSTFTVCLPMPPGDGEESAPPGHAAPGTRLLAGMRVLTVDDDRNTREMLQEALERAGARVLAAESAQDALGKIRAFLPDVLVSDIGMPNEDGYALLRQVRGLPRELGGATPAIALTGYARDEDQAAALRAGYQAVTPKPVDLDELLSTIASMAKTPSPPA